MAVWKAAIFPGANVTSYPGCESHAAGYKFHADTDVVVDGRLITSRGPGTACNFALAIVKEMKGAEVRDKIAAALLHC
jgi:putative intracellular protease/amidase